MKEVVKLCLEEQKKKKIKVPEFVGLQEIEVNI